VGISTGYGYETELGEQRELVKGNARDHKLARNRYCTGTKSVTKALCAEPAIVANMASLATNATVIPIEDGIASSRHINA